MINVNKKQHNNKNENRKQNIAMISQKMSIIDILECSDDINKVAANLAILEKQKIQDIVNSDQIHSKNTEK